MDFSWLPLHLQGAYPMSGGIKISPLLPLCRFTISRVLINSLRNNMEVVLIILLSFQLKITCAEV